MLVYQRVRGLAAMGSFGIQFKEISSHNAHQSPDPDPAAGSLQLDSEATHRKQLSELTVSSTA
jgi:hypothetical protein